MFFKNKKDIEKEIIKKHTAAAVEKELQHLRLRLAQIASELDGSETASNVIRLSRMCEAMGIYQRLLEGDKEFLDKLKRGVVLSNNWTLIKRQNQPLTIELNE